MHYRNGRAAVNGDPVVLPHYNGKIVAGTVYNLNEAARTCNCDVAVIRPGGSDALTCQNVGNMFHAEDAFQACEAKLIADSAPPGPPAAPPSALETVQEAVGVDWAPPGPPAAPPAPLEPPSWLAAQGQPQPPPA